jgi:hypothetical protein
VPTPILASFDCVLQTACTMASCDPAGEIPALVEVAGDAWTLTIPDTPPLTGTALAGGAEANSVTIAFPPQALGFDTVSGLLDIYPSGQMTLTVHMGAPAGVMDMTGLATSYTGLCAGEGG